MLIFLNHASEGLLMPLLGGEDAEHSPPSSHDWAPDLSLAWYTEALNSWTNQ